MRILPRVVLINIDPNKKYALSEATRFYYIGFYIINIYREATFNTDFNYFFRSIGPKLFCNTAYK